MNMPPQDSDKIEAIKSHITSYPNFPKPGVLFRDIFSVFQNPEVFTLLREVLVDHVKSITPPVQCVVALDARGFLFGPIIALDLKVPFVPIRKKGKLPGNVKAVSYQLEYGEDTLEIQIDCLKNKAKVLIVDDLLATGGSFEAACKLVELVGGEVVECLAIMELTGLNGREKLQVPVHALLKY